VLIAFYIVKTMADDLQGNLQNYKLQLQQVSKAQTGWFLWPVSVLTGTAAACMVLCIGYLLGMRPFKMPQNKQSFILSNCKMRFLGRGSPYYRSHK
jgi:hypothetical protein